MAIAVAASVVGVTAIGFTIWGVKKYLDNKNDPNKSKGNKGGNKDNIDEGGSHKNNDDVKNPKSNNEEGYDYVSEVNNRLKAAGKEKVEDLNSFNKAVDVIKNHEFNEKETEQLGEFLKVVKGEKKVPKDGGSGGFMLIPHLTFAKNVVYVELADGMNYGLYFKMKGFEIQKYDKNVNLIYSLKL